MPDVAVMLYSLMGFMIIGSIVAIETRDLLSSVICVGAVGFALSVINLLLGGRAATLTTPPAGTHWRSGLWWRGSVLC